MARKRKTQQELPLAAADAVEASAAVSSDAPATSPQVAPVRAWRVVKDTRVSLFGHLTWLTAGTRVTAAEYGPDGLARIAAQVELAPE